MFLLFTEIINIKYLVNNHIVNELSLLLPKYKVDLEIGIFVKPCSVSVDSELDGETDRWMSVDRLSTAGLE